MKVGKRYGGSGGGWRGEAYQCASAVSRSSPARASSTTGLSSGSAWCHMSATHWYDSSATSRRCSRSATRPRCIIRGIWSATGKHPVGAGGDRPERGDGEGYDAVRPGPGDDAGGPAAMEGGGAARAPGAGDRGQPEGGLAGAGGGGAAREDLSGHGEGGGGGGALTRRRVGGAQRE